MNGYATNPKWEGVDWKNLRVTGMIIAGRFYGRKVANLQARQKCMNRQCNIPKKDRPMTVKCWLFTSDYILK